tara:strand:- start:232 stop:411 length:180 start_codon:yes stop_codon:yes gene_type:complete
MANKEKPGLWANIRAKRKRGGKPAKPGEKGYPSKESWKKVTSLGGGGKVKAVKKKKRNK